MDSRVVSSSFTNSEIGDNYIIKNAGNFVPYPDDLLQIANTTSAAGALELTCAMRLLFELRNEMDKKTGSPLELWIKKHGAKTIEKFNFLNEGNDFIGPVPYKQETDSKFFSVFIDPDQNHNLVNCIQQLENIAAYPFLKERLVNNDLMLHALWYDIHTGNVHLLSRQRQRFVEVNERSYFGLMQEVDAVSEEKN
ncbi:BCA1-like protein [Mya arenaria]|uniref:carbonic anhydrase n=1 Tax=Mya arenaria TaxID=6604 RepID=A0ABY7G335_MYAAR|nr:BCA1-like protein [Mya arenaria]